MAVRQPGEGEQTLVEFITAWQAQDWEGMAAHCQRSWLAMRERSKVSPAQWLEGWYGHYSPASFRVQDNTIAIGLPPGMIMRRLRAKVMLTRAGDRPVEWNVLCEDSDGRPSPAGDWGVNPVSGLVGLYRRDRVLTGDGAAD